MSPDVRKNNKRVAPDDEMSYSKITPAAKKGHWSGGLKDSMKDPDLIVFKDNIIVIIKDKYPKACHHYLVLPHLDLPTLKQVSGKHLPTFQHMHEAAHLFIQDEHPHINFRYGYHAVPSMSQIHLHVISSDFHSPCLKTKKHWNSFTTDYFRTSADVMEELKMKDKIISPKEETSKALLNTPLKCHVCQHMPKTMPQLKEHIQTHMTQATSAKT